MSESDPVIISDGRQSPIASEIQRGTCRLMRTFGNSVVTELSLSSGHRADIAALSRTGEIWIVEIKSCLADFRADDKWDAYRNHCDRFFFAVSQDFPLDVLPPDTGLILADRYSGAIIREAPEHKIAGARRKAVTLRFARAAATRLQSLQDPGPVSDL